MPNTTQSASWDFNPTDPVHLSATFSFDTQDTQDSAPVAPRSRPFRRDSPAPPWWQHNPTAPQSPSP
jgi:hypothetical protein